MAIACIASSKMSRCDTGRQLPVSRSRNKHPRSTAPDWTAAIQAGRPVMSRSTPSAPITRYEMSAGDPARAITPELFQALVISGFTKRVQKPSCTCNFWLSRTLTCMLLQSESARIERLNIRADKLTLGRPKAQAPGSETPSYFVDTACADLSYVRTHG